MKRFSVEGFIALRNYLNKLESDTVIDDWDIDKYLEFKDIDEYNKIYQTSYESYIDLANDNVPIIEVTAKAFITDDYDWHRGQ